MAPQAHDNQSPSGWMGRLFARTPITVKGLVLMLGVGFLAWAVIDRVQTGNLDRILHGQLTERIEWMAHHDRVLFDGYVRAHAKAVKLFASIEGFGQYVSRPGWERPGEPVVRHEQPPGWLPRNSVSRTFLRVRCALLLDASGRVRETFDTGHGLPAEFLNPSVMLRTLSHGQTLLTEVEGRPFIVASETLLSPDGIPRATLILVSPIDHEFLTASQGVHYRDHMVALFDSSEDSVLIASSDEERTAPGTRMSALEGAYIVTGKTFFDYGSSDLRVQFATLVSTDDVRALGAEVLALERRQRALAAAVLVGLACVMIFLIARRIHRLGHGVLHAARTTLGLDLKSGQRWGDQLIMLEGLFNDFVSEIDRSRRALELETTEKLSLMQRALDAEQAGRDLAMLLTVTDVLGVAVASVSPEGDLEAANPLMNVYAQTVGGIEVFRVDHGGDADLAVRDRQGRPRIFHIMNPKIERGANFLLVRDVTAEKEAEAEVYKLTGAVEHSPEGVLITDMEGRVEYVNIRWALLMGSASGDALGSAVREFLPPQLCMETHPMIRSTVLSGGVWQEEYCRDAAGPGEGCTRWLLTQVSAFRGPGDAATHMLYMTQDISERKRMEERLREISITDELTGLVNRRGFIMLADQSLKAATREGRCRYLLFVDMDNMKQINDSLGHAEGDRALVEVGEVLKSTYRRSDIVGRLGGDEFAVLVQCGQSEEGEDTVVRRLEDALDRANAREDRAFTLTVSAGVTRYDPEDPPEVGPLLSRADSLMYEVKRAKKEGRG